VILGGGTGGTMTANRLRRRFDEDEAEIHVVDRDDRHVYQPGLLFVPFGLAEVDEIVRPGRRQLRNGIRFHEAEIESVDVDRDEVLLEIELVTEFSAGEVDGAGGTLVSYDGREVPFDLLVTVPLHAGQAFVERSPGLGDALGFVPTDKETLQTAVAPNVFALGDATDLPTSKAGSVTHFESEVLVENIARFLAGEEFPRGYDGHANCFVETGFQKALLIDFNYETEPLPGHFPGPVGLPLLRESRLNHLGKLAFQWLYWHALLPGRDLPLIGPAMPTAGKDFAALSAS
jgi:NADPH-dependent 2,4-dienoyl-CoA reductase/sulfur reductase-like enzyme